MSGSVMPLWLLGWTGAASAGAFGLFGFDKWRAGRDGRRIAESALWWVSVLGGWPGFVDDCPTSLCPDVDVNY